MRRDRRSSCLTGPVLRLFGNTQSSSFALTRALSASRRSTSAWVSRMGRLERWYFGVWSFFASRSIHLKASSSGRTAADRNQPDGFADRILQTLDQPVELIARRKLLSLLDWFRRKVGAARRIGRDVSVLDRGNEDGAEPPLEVLKGLNSLAFDCLWLMNACTASIEISDNRAARGRKRRFAYCAVS
jgi:hypothetical protein